MFYLKLIYKKTKELIEIIFYRKKIKVDKNKKQVYLMLTATYENLGDIAITLTEIKFIKEQLGEEYQLIEVPVEDTCKVFFDMKRKIKKDSIIILVGGGNNGDLYEFIEKRRRFILKKFKKYKIISFPQTVFYSNTKNGVKYKKLFFKLCEKCYDLTLVAREKGSYNLYIENVSKTKVLLSPDIVFYNNEDKEETRKGVSIVFRNDIEKLIISDGAFANCKGLKSFSIPKSVTSLFIGKYAFYNCTELETFTISAYINALNIDDGAFSFCESLKNFIVPSSITSLSIGYSTFSSCKKFTEFIVPNSVTSLSIGAKAFENCENFEKFSFFEGINLQYLFIGNQAFYNCKKLTEFNVPNRVNDIFINENAFNEITQIHMQ